VTRYVLFKTHQSSDCPIKREDLTRIITNNYRRHVLPMIAINEAKERLIDTFSYEMRDLQRTRTPATHSGRPAHP
jgi:melanoma-associated antigen